MMNDFHVSAVNSEPEIEIRVSKDDVPSRKRPLQKETSLPTIRLQGIWHFPGG